MLFMHTMQLQGNKGSAYCGLNVSADALTTATYLRAWRQSVPHAATGAAVIGDERSLPQHTRIYIPSLDARPMEVMLALCNHIPYGTL